MEITLRKANAVQASINEQLKALDLSATVVLNEFEEVKNQIEVARNSFWKNYSARNKMLSALYEIRSAVATANASAGINDMLANVALLEKKISHYNMLASKGEQTALLVLNGRLKKQAEDGADRRMYNFDAVETSIFSVDEIEQFKKNAADFKRLKQSTQDRLLELNIETKISLSANTRDLLLDQNII